MSTYSTEASVKTSMPSFFKNIFSSDLAVGQAGSGGDGLGPPLGLGVHVSEDDEVELLPAIVGGFELRDKVVDGGRDRKVLGGGPDPEALEPHLRGIDSGHVPSLGRQPEAVAAFACAEIDRSAGVQR